jgi:hypothetical protein
MTSVSNVIEARVEHRENPHWDVVNYRQEISRRNDEEAPTGLIPSPSLSPPRVDDLHSRRFFNSKGKARKWTGRH